jgi:hypothetical protein
MTTEQLKAYIRSHPESIEAAAYALGLKDKAVELSREIEKMRFDKDAD